MRAAFFFWGVYQDSTMELRFTDIDYFVFTDAARFMNNGGSPYDRETYRYTPLLAWILLPTNKWFSFGKLLFALGDIIAGYFILQLLRIRKVEESKAVLYSCIWLLNPMVCTISTRGSSEGLLGAMVISFVWALYTKRYALSGVLVGLAIHFKIYPIIYVPTVIWAIEGRPVISKLFNGFITKERILFGMSTAVSFCLLTGIMYYIYGYPFLHHTYLHHLSRVDHRHNFSPYSTLLYMASSPTVAEPHMLEPSSWAFVPQLLLSGIILPLAFAKRDVIKTMFLQTIAFVTFNKVCTSQYFMWYMVLLPFYGPGITKMSKCTRNWTIIAIILWIAAQGLWIREGYNLEFLGESTFYPGLFYSTLIFFIVNCWGMGLFISNM